MKVSAARWLKADTSKVEQAAALYGVLVTPVPEGLELVGWTWEHGDGSIGLVKAGESVRHRSQPVRMRPVFAPIFKNKETRSMSPVEGKMVDAICFEPDGTAVAVSLEPTLDRMRDYIGGGWLEAITVGEWHAYFDEEGKLKGMAPNLQATQLAHAMGWRAPDVLCGAVIFLGTDDEAGEEKSVPQSVIDKAVELGLLVLPG